MFFKPKKNTMSGTSLVEAMIYIAILVVLFSGIVRGVFMLSNSYRNVKTYRSIESSAVSSMERMVREIRNATDINAGQTSYGISAGSLSLNGTNASGTAYTVRFFASSSRLYLEENSTNVGPLTPSNVIVSNLTFRHFSTSTSEAVKIEMTISSASSSSVYFSKNFYGTAVLRGSY